MSKKLNLSVWLLIVTAMVNAQNDSIQHIYLDEVIVVAMKVPVLQRNTSKPVQIISEQTIERNLGQDLVQLINQEAGIIINGSYSNPGKNKEIYIRGAASKYTLVLIDGIPVSDASDVGAVFDLRLVPLSNVKRIEILKGSQSTLYGSDAIAGVINIITRSDTRDGTQLTGSASYGSLNTREATVSLKGRISRLDYSLVLGHFATGGISEAMEPADTLQFRKDPSERNSLQAGIDLDLAENFRLSPFLRYSRFNGDYDDGPFTDADNTFGSEMVNPGVEISYKSRGSGLATITGLYHYVQFDRSFQDSFGESEFKGRTHNADVFGSFQIRDQLQLLTGILYQKAQILDDQALEKDPAYFLWSPYVTLLATNLNGWNLELGYRLNYHSDFGYHPSISIAPSFDLKSNFRLFASFTTGFKSPTLNQLYGQFGPNPNLRPESSIAYEFGVVSNALNEKLRTQLTIYKRSISEVITFDFTNGYQNQNAQNDYGMEFLVSHDINEKISINATYDYVDGRLNTKTGAGQDTTFYNLIRRPRHSAGLGLKFVPVSNLYISANGSYYGDRIDYYFNPNNFFTQEEIGLDPYILVNAHIEYRALNNKLRLFCDLKNLFNAKYFESYGFSTLRFNGQLGIVFHVL